MTLVPPRHWLVIQEASPFRATLHGAGDLPEHVESVPVKAGHVAFFAPRTPGVAIEAKIELERYDEDNPRVEAAIGFLAPAELQLSTDVSDDPATRGGPWPTMALLTNGRGGMARLPVDFGNVTSKYDCLLGANLHPELPVDRHVFAKRARLWVVRERGSCASW